jgi:polysaccharide pyruvyl transferase WcaK-like protein
MSTRIVIDPGSHHGLNLGDDAMLAVALDRLWARLPDARISVVTADSARLAESFPAAEPLPGLGRYRWFGEGGEADPPAGPWRRRATRLLRRPVPGPVGPVAVAAERVARGRGDAETRAYTSALARADLVLIAGRGGLTDVFAQDARSLLGTVELAARLGVPAALVSQGIGPLEDPDLRARAARALPRAELVGLREGRLGPAILRELGVPAERIAVTGDDALALAAAPPDRAAPRDAIGVSVRVAPYAGADGEDAGRVVAAARAVAERMAAPLVGLPVSRYPGLDDAVALAGHDIAGGADATAPRDLAARVARCRIVVSGSYHAAVFALAQGAPAVGVAANAYYDGKLRGLAAQFGDGCPVLGPGDPGLADAIAAAWARAGALRAPLQDAAQAQIAQGERLYDRLAALARGTT